MRCVERALEPSHPLYAVCGAEAGDAFLEAEDELVNAMSSIRAGPPDDLDDDAEQERTQLLRLAQRALNQAKSAQIGTPAESMLSREIVALAKTQLLLAVTFLRTPGAAAKGDKLFAESMSTLKRLKAKQRDAAALDEAEWHRRHAFARYRAGDFARALPGVKQREKLLTAALGPGHPTTVGARRLRVAWTRELGSGFSLGGNAYAPVDDSGDEAPAPSS